MKILQLSTYDIQGGAARASYRLMNGLIKIGEQCDLLVLHKSGASNNNVHNIDGANKRNSTFIQDNYINKQRAELSNTLFSFSCSGHDVAGLDLVKSANVVNLHWVAGFQSPRTIAHLASLGKPVVWTLHDQWPFTGGCHYSAGCTKYRSICSQCPQLIDDTAGLIPALMQDKMYYFEDTRITIVSPSQWLADCARESTIFRRHRIETIPNSLETDTFSPFDRKTARIKLGLHEEGLIFLFGSEHRSEKRKGYKELLSSIKVCMESEDFSHMVRERKISLMYFGHPEKELASRGMHVIPLGFLETDEDIRNAYCAADIFILPSLEDNFPNTMLESMSCGTPVVAFNTGGMPDVIIHERTGLLVPPGDTRALGSAIVSLTFDRQKRELMSQNCRTVAVEKYSLETQARRYVQLYDDLRRSLVGDHQGSSKMSETPVELDVAIFDRTPGPFLNSSYNRILLKSFALSLKRPEFDGAGLIGVAYRIVVSVKRFFDAVIERVMMSK